MAKSLILAAAVLLAFAATASAQCIQCSSCSTNTCWNLCSTNCQTAFNGKTCEGAGSNFGATTAKATCSFLITYCSQVSPPKPSPRSFNPVTLQQCQNIYFAACVKNAEKTVMNTNIVPPECKKGLTSGFKGCSKDLFQEVFRADALERCKKQASTYKP